MALTDLTKYNLLDLLLASSLPDEDQGKALADYMDAFAGYLSEQVSTQLTDADDEAMQKLLAEPECTPEKIEQFYRDRIPHLDGYLLAATLQFKKGFILDFYRGMLKANIKQNDPATSTWIKIVASAEEDNWENVWRLLEHIKKNFWSNPSPEPLVQTSSQV